MKNLFINKSLTGQVLFLMIVMLVIVLVSFCITNEIAKNIIEDKASDSVEKILLQVEDKILSFYTDMEGIATSLIYSPTVQTYINEKNVLNKILMNKDVGSVFANTSSLKANIKGIELYDSNGVLLTSLGISSGTKILSRVSSTEYSGVLKLPEGDRFQSYYSISIPVYNLVNNIAEEYIGVCIFIMDVSNFHKILNNSLIVDTADLLLLDQDNKIITSVGRVGNDTFDVTKWENDIHYIIQKRVLSRTGWKIVSVIPKADLLEDMDIIKRLNIAAYIIIIGILCLFLFIFFLRILKPIRELINFMNSYPKKTGKSRFKVSHQNEIGVLGINLNKMLDDIDELNKKINLTQKRMYEIEISRKQMEIASLRNQINPHFLYNTLECIRAMALYHKVQDIADISTSLSRIFRYSVKGEDFVSIADEISHIKEYAKIINFRFNGKIQIEINTDDDILSVKMLKMTLQPIVENAVFHGLEKKLGNGLVMVDAKRMEQEYILFIINDNGCGMEDEILIKLQSIFEQDQVQDYNHYAENIGKADRYRIGILNIYRRLKLIYGSKAGMSIHSKINEGTTVSITIPVNAKA